MRLIDADALMKEFAEFVKDSNNSDFADAPTWNDAVSLVGSFPTIEERKNGKWVYHDDDDMRFDTYHCSSCRKLFTVDAERFDDIGFVKEDLKYCPNCGARMRGLNDEVN